METERYGVDPSMPLVAPTLVPLIKVLIQKQPLEAIEEASIGTDDNNVEIDFSRFFLEKIYSVQ